MQNTYNEIKDIIETTIGEQGKHYVAGKADGLGWLEINYKNTCFDGTIPMISIKQREKAVHVYVMMWSGGKPITEDYIKVFGKSAVGVSCIRIRKLTEERKEALREIAQIAREHYDRTGTDALYST